MYNSTVGTPTALWTWVKRKILCTVRHVCCTKTCWTKILHIIYFQRISDISVRLTNPWWRLFVQLFSRLVELVFQYHWQFQMMVRTLISENREMLFGYITRVENKFERIILLQYFNEQVDIVGIVSCKLSQVSELLMSKLRKPGIHIAHQNGQIIMFKSYILCRNIIKKEIKK